MGDQRRDKWALYPRSVTVQGDSEQLLLCPRVPKLRRSGHLAPEYPRRKTFGKSASTVKEEEEMMDQLEGITADSAR